MCFIYFFSSILEHNRENEDFNGESIQSTVLLHKDDRRHGKLMKKNKKKKKKLNRFLESYLQNWFCDCAANNVRIQTLNIQTEKSRGKKKNLDPMLMLKPHKIAFSADKIHSFVFEEGRPFTKQRVFFFILPHWDNSGVRLSMHGIYYTTYLPAYVHAFRHRFILISIPSHVCECVVIMRNIFLSSECDASYISIYIFTR